MECLINKMSFSKVVFLKTNYFQIANYGLYYGIGAFLVSQLFFIHLYRLQGDFPLHFVLFFVLIVSLSTVIFSKILYLAYNYKRLFKTPLVLFNETGYAAFGGFVGIFFSLWIMGNYFYPGNRMALFDLMFISLPLGQIFQRIGCMTYGCCYGHAYEGPLAVKYKDEDCKAYRDVKDIPVHNTQLYSIIKNIILFLVVNIIFIKFPYHGVAFFTWLIMYGILRFFVDFMRYVRTSYIMGLRITQIFSLVILSVGLYGFLKINLVPYYFKYNFSEAFYNTLPLIIYSFLGFGILFIFYGYHSLKIGYYVVPKNKK